jgi:Fe-S cluster assembly scaffold protein SufB
VWQIPVGDNYYTALNSAVFSDGSFCYIPKGVKSPMELSTYFRINAEETGQFERTLIVAEEDSYVSYLEGCTAPAYDTNQVRWLEPYGFASWVTRRARWVTLRARWVTLRARWATLRARWVTLRAR